MSEVNFGTYYESDFFNMVTKESLRMFNPFILSSPRRLYKNVKLGKYNFRKGTNLIIPILTMHQQEKFHKNAMEFDINRQTPEARKAQKRMTDMPFFAGRRRCIGQYMGEMMVKLVISQLLQKFELKKNAECNPRKVQDLTYGLSELNLFMRPRK
jgi:cytochrome P450